MEDISQAAAEAVEAALASPELQVEEPVEEQEEISYPKLVDDEEPDGEADDDATELEEEPEEQVESVLPDGYVDVAVVAPEELATQFKLLDEQGEVEVPSLVVEYKANGQVRRDRLDQVVKMAQWGVYNAEKEEQAKQIQQEAYRIQEERNQFAEKLQAREEQIQRLLEDDDYLYRVRGRYAQENSPEARARRAEEQVRQLNAERQLQYIEQRGTQFYEGEVKPAIQMIADALPSVTANELAERVVMSVQPHLRRGPTGEAYIPEESYDAIRNYIVEDLTFWAQMQHQRRGGGATSPDMEKAQRELEKARVEAQKAKRAVGKKTRPVGKAQADRKSKREQPINSVDDAVDSALESVLASIQ